MFDQLIYFLSGVPKNISLRKLSLEVYMSVITNLKSKLQI